MKIIDTHRDRFGVEPILRVPTIPVSTYYGWVARRRRPSPRDIEQVWPGEQIERIHHDSGQTHGAPRIHARLRREGIRCSRKRVERLMRQQACRARSCASVGAAAPAATQRPRQRRTWASGTSPLASPTGCGRRHPPHPHG